MSLPCAVKVKSKLLDLKTAHHPHTHLLQRDHAHICSSAVTCDQSKWIPTQDQDNERT